MKILIFTSFLFFTASGFAQNLQLHYDMRHTTAPDLNTRNFPTFSFEYFKDIDTISSGSFLLKLEAHMNGENNNLNHVFAQISQSLRFWKPKVYLSLNYSGGLGTTRSMYGFYITNAYGVGISYPFQWKGAWFATVIAFRMNAFERPSYDPQFTFYFGKGFFDYKLFVTGSFVFWTQNNNQGTALTHELTGKKFMFFGDPQIWFRVKNKFSVGSRISVYHQLLKDDNSIQLYPTLGMKVQF